MRVEDASKNHVWSESDRKGVVDGATTTERIGRRIVYRQIDRMLSSSNVNLNHLVTLWQAMKA